MNHPRQEEFEEYLRRTIGPMVASPRRKSQMQEELLAHLLESYHRRSRATGGKAGLANVAENILGDPDQLRWQLQASVPFLEYIQFKCLGRKETIMKTMVAWCAVIVALLVGLNVMFPASGAFPAVGALLITGGFILLLLGKNSGATPHWLGPRLLWLVGALGILFGTALILPALAKLTHEQDTVAKTGAIPPAANYLIVLALAMGILIVLEGLGFVIHGFRMRLARTA